MNQKAAIERAILRFIDAHLDLYAEIRVTTITHQFHINRSKASAVLAVYRTHEKSRKNLRYDVSKKVYIRSMLFEAAFLEGSSLSYLNACDQLFCE
jgi:hypothetical protein